MTPKTWFITGTFSSLGRMLTERLLARGDVVAATLRTVAALDDLRERHGDRLWTATLDVTASGAVRRVVDRAFGELGRIDVLVNNAGYGLLGAAEEVSDEQIRRQVDTNLVGSIQVIRAVLPHLRSQGGGRILQLASEGGQIALPGLGLYHATKCGIEGFCEATAKEVAPFGIGLTMVEPGAARTSFGIGLDRAQPSAAYAGTPADEVRRAFAEGTFPVTGDADKFVDAMIATADVSPAPLRLTLGSSAYHNVREALTARLAALEAQRVIALAADADA